MTKEELQAIRELMREELGPINQELKEIKSDLKQVKEKVDILYDWVDGIDLKVTKLQKIV